MNKQLKVYAVHLVLCLFFSTSLFAQPDLSIDKDRLIRDLRTDLLDNNDQCYINEGCVGGYGARQLIKFTTHIRNVGDQDFVVGAPPSDPSLENEIWEWDECHQHWHYESYARYILYDQNGNETPAGFKNGFCLMDSECSGGGSLTYNCRYQGISAGCGDIYSWSLPCQWIDVTDIPSGVYRLVNQVNWLRSSDYFNNSEVNYSNNEASICIQISRDANGRHLVNVLSDANCGCTDNDSDGVCAIEDCNDNNANLPATPGTSCNDNNPNTGNDVILADGCTCQGTIISCPDADNDGICANEDCDDNNPNLPAAPGTSCNDNNSNTSNDVILADGCTCRGTSDGGETTISCGPLTITYGGGQIDMVGGDNYKFKIHDLDNGWNEVFSCVSNCGGSQTAVLPNGFYKIKIYNFNWSVVECDVDVMLTNSTGACPDADNDGVCAASDCNDNNPSIPATPGTPCSDNNSSTTNDVILADGCTCRGTTTTCTDADGDGVCATDDCNDNNANLPATPGTNCNDNNSNTSNDVILADGCTCRGTTTNCTDADGDGVCADADCNDNNANLPATPGTSCNDNNSNTTNDVILTDGCTCRGTTSGGGGDNGTTISCGEITIVYGSGQISITGNSGSIYRFKIHDLNNGWVEVLNCVTSDCGSSQTASLPDGLYKVKIYNASWVNICDQDVTLSGGGGGGGSCTDADGDGVCADADCNDNNANLPATPGTSCNDNNSSTTNDVILADGCTCRGTTSGGSNGTSVSCGEITIVYGSGQISMTGNSGSIYRFKIHDLNNGWIEVLNCVTSDCGSSQTASLLDGLYKVKIYNSSWVLICDQDVNLSGGGGSCTDADGDGVCAASDCNDNNPNIPATPGTSCNDNNSNTTNDVILADGCTCRGTDDTCLDSDGDGVCNDDDCAINNPNLPATPGSSCNDNNSNTSNDVILADGCTCQGTSTGGGTTGTCSDINITTSANTINITGLTAPIEIIKVYRTNNGWQLVYDCVANCGTEQEITDLTPGNYVVEVQFFSASWGVICSEQKTLVVSTINSNDSSTPSFLIGEKNTSNLFNKPVKFDLYPNPAQEKIWVNLSNWDHQKVELKIVNHLAQVVARYSIQHQEGMVHSIDIPNLGNGLHFVQISNGTQTLTKKLFISK